MCNLYSITTNQAAIAALFRVINQYVGNLLPMPGVFPDYPAPVVRPTNPARLVFIDETAASTNMVRLNGRCPRGIRLIGHAPHGHWKTITFVAGLRNDGMVAPFVFDGPMNAFASV